MVQGFLLCVTSALPCSLLLPLPTQDPQYNNRTAVVKGTKVGGRAVLTLRGQQELAGVGCVV